MTGKSFKHLFYFLLGAVVLWSMASGSTLAPRPSPLDLPVKHALLNESRDFGGSDQQKEKKATTHGLSKTKAVALSLLLPGAGQYYAGAKGRAEVFIGAEVAVWAGVLAFHTYGNWKEDDYIRYAERHAGIDPSGKNDDFYKNLTFYNNREDYNTAGRIINPTAPYYPYTQSFYWQWESDDARTTYRSIRNSSKTAFRKATFMIGMAVFNRIIAGIDSFRIVSRMAQQTEQENEFSKVDDTKIKVKFNANPFSRNPSIALKLLRQF